MEDFPEGFPQAAAFVNADPSFPIYRRFGRGRTRIILELQAQLMTLEKKLDQYDQELSKDDNTDWTLHQTGFRSQSKLEAASNERCKKHAMYYERFKETLKLYDKTVIRDIVFRMLPPPSHQARKNVGRYFYENKPLVDGEDDHMTYIEDLVAVGSSGKDTLIETSISSTLGSKPLHFFKVN